jgi:integrase
MEQAFERVRYDGDEDMVPKLYRRTYQAAKGRERRSFYAIFTDWQGIRRREALGKNEKIAKKKIIHLDKDNAQQVDFGARKVRRLTFATWADKCSAVMVGRDTLNRKHLEPVFGKMKLSDIGDKEVIEYRKMREAAYIIRHGKPSKKKVSPVTVNKELGLLCKLLLLAQQKGIVTKVPDFAKAPEHGRDRVLDGDEYRALLNNSPPWLRRVFIGAYETSLSRSDLLNLKRDEIHATDKTDANGRKVHMIHLADGRDKTKVRQEIPILTDGLVALVDELEAEFAKLPNTEGLLFTYGGQRIPENFFEYHVRKTIKAAGIKGFTFHDFRHTAITRWHVMNLPMAAAMRMAGHSSAQSHKKYVNLKTNMLVDVLTGCLQRQTEEREKAAKSA